LEYLKRFHPWGSFVFFLTANCVLGYFPLPFMWKVTVLILGIILPLILAARQTHAEKTESIQIFHEDFLNPIPAWLWMGLAAGVVLIYFYQLSAVTIWPTRDEGLFGSLGLRLSEKWDWKFYYTAAQDSPLLIWFLSFSLRWFQSPFWGLWSVPVLFSAATVFLTYFISRLYFPRSFSFLAVCLWAFSLCSLGCGRFCLPTFSVLPWELICFGMTALFYQEDRPQYKKMWAVLSGFWTGLGYFTFTSWPVIALPVVLIVFFDPSQKHFFKNRKFLMWFFCPFFIAVVPFLAAMASVGYGEHIFAMSRFNHWFSSKDQWDSAISYFSSLFWGPWGSYASQGEDWVRLNPILGAMFFLGCVQSYRFRFNGMIQWIGLVFVFCLLPGVLSANFLILRIVQIFPILILISVLGLMSLLIEVRRSYRLFLFFLFLILSIAIDNHEFSQSHRDPLSTPEVSAQSSFPVESIRSYRILKSLADQAGSGFVFTEFMQVPRDNSLLVMTYAFNAAENPRLKPEQAQWAGVVANLHYYSFLAKRFPEARWYWVHEGRTRGSECILGIIPIDEKNKDVIKTWVQAHHYFRQVSLALDNISEKNTYHMADRILNQPPASISSDRFLESCYWERRAQFYYDYHFETHYDDQVAALKQAVAQGYPAAHLYYDLGCLSARKGQVQQALSDFKTALRVEPNYSDVLSAMDYFKTTKAEPRHQ